MGQIIECSFNLFKEGRTYTGHHRQYVLESAYKTCYAPETREMIKLREAFGYYGHGRRELAKKLKLPEVDAVKMPNGSVQIVENIPASVTTQFDIDKNTGDVTHTQELALTEPGKVVAGLHASRMGGFSWACGGSDGGRSTGTRLDSFEGFDYVKTPGFALNRGYILESASSCEVDMVMESVSKISGLPGKTVEKYLQYWGDSAAAYAADLEAKLEESAVYESAIRYDLDTHRAKLEAAEKRLNAAESAEQRRRTLIMEAAKKSVVVVPDAIMEAMLGLASEQDFEKVARFYESAGRVNIGGLPLPGNSFAGNRGRVLPRPFGEPPEYGTAAAGVDFAALEGGGNTCRL